MTGWFLLGILGGFLLGIQVCNLARLWSKNRSGNKPRSMAEWRIDRGDHVEVWDFQPPDDGAYYTIVDDEWNDDRTERRIYCIGR